MTALGARRGCLQDGLWLSNLMEGKTYFTVFAGRRRYLSVLMVYIRPLLEQRVVDTLHLWDYARSAEDRGYLRTLEDDTLGVQVIAPPASDHGARFPNKWKGYYAHYAALLGTADVLIKCDDDVVFIGNLPALLSTVRRESAGSHEQQHLLYYPSIVNNDVSAVFQAADGVIKDPAYVVRLRPSIEEGRHSRTPMSDWFNCSHCARHVHGLFLENPDRFFTGCVHEWHVAARVPINFFAMRGAAVRQHFGAYATEQFVDEPYFTALLTERTGLPSLLVSDTVVVHFAFSFQRMAGERELLERYRKLARDRDLLARLHRRFGSRELSHSCPVSAPSALFLARRQPPYPNATQSRAKGRGGRKARGGRGRGAISGLAT